MRSARLTLALCDDHPVFLRGLVDLLRGEPDLHVAIAVSSTAQLLAALQETAVDLVILDIQLPEESGLEAIPRLVGPRLVLVLSAFDDAGLVKRVLEAGAQGFVRKDAEPRVLLKAVADAAAGRTVLSADLALKLAQSLRTEPDQLAFAERVRALTPRQREVLRELSAGRSNREVAAALSLSEGTVKNHVTQILQAVGARDRVRLALLVARYGIG
jgi:two-component system nitrate/nitrite response regulator NarL